MSHDDIRYEQGFKDIFAGIDDKKELLRMVKVYVFGQNYGSNIDETNSEEINNTQSEKNESFRKIISLKPK